MTEEQVESAVIPEVESEDWEAAAAREAVRFKAGPPAYQRDRFFCRVVVFTLGFVALGALGRRERARRQLAKSRRKAANRRRNWQHHASRRLAERAGTVVLERLDVRGMTRSAKGTADEPGRNVGQKAGLNRAIAGTGWTAFAAMLECKAANVIHVPAAYTSQTCHECGAADAASRGSQAESVCVACGHAANADVNAAKKIPASGTGASARRGASAAPATREISTEAA